MQIKGSTYAIFGTHQLHLPHFNYRAPESVASFLSGAKTLNPRMVTLVEEEMGDVFKGDFLNWFVGTLHHY
jgi:hypothetical protein